MVQKQYRFWTNNEDQDLIDFMDAQQNISQFLKELINDYRLGNLVREADIDLKRKKLEVDIKFKEVMIQIKEQELLFNKAFDKTPSLSAKKAMKIGIENQIPDTPSCFDESNHRIMCPECGACFVFSVDQHDIPDAKEFFIDHYIKKHGLKFPEQIQKELQSF